MRREFYDGTRKSAWDPQTYPILVSEDGSVIQEFPDDGSMKATVFSSDRSVRLRFRRDGQDPVTLEVKLLVGQDPYFFEPPSIAAVAPGAGSGIAAGPRPSVAVAAAAPGQTLRRTFDAPTFDCDLPYLPGLEDHEPDCIQIASVQPPGAVGAPVVLGRVRVLPRRIAVIGDSVSAGFQSATLSAPDQVKGYVPQVGTAAGKTVTLPLIGKLFPTPQEDDFNGNPFPIFFGRHTARPYLDGSIVFTTRGEPRPNTNAVRLNLDKINLNLAVPGMNTLDVLTATTSVSSSRVADILVKDILGTGNPRGRIASIIERRGKFPTQVEQAKAIGPSLLLVWVGNNDVLDAALQGSLRSITPIGQFAKRYRQLVDEVNKVTDDFVLGEIGSVDALPLLVPVDGRSLAEHGIKLPFDVQIPGFPFPARIGADLETVRVTVTSVVPGEPPIRPGSMTSFINYLIAARAEMGDPGEPRFSQGDVLDPSELATLRSHIGRMNALIGSQASRFRIPVTPTERLFADVLARGRVISGVQVRAAFSPVMAENFFSLDGIHPADVGYRILADQWIHVVNVAIRSRRKGFGGFRNELRPIAPNETQPVDP